MFRFGMPLPANEVFDREEEMRILQRACRNLAQKKVRQDYALIGIRRIGKTSLLNKTIVQSTLEGIVPVTIDCENLTFELFIKIYAASVLEAFLKSLKKQERLEYRIKELAREAPGIAIAKLGELLGQIRSLGLRVAEQSVDLMIEMREKEASRTLREEELFHYFESAVNLPERLGQEYKKYFLIVLDEFQFTSPYAHGRFFGWMRRNIQRHTHVNYIVAGSNIGMMKDIVLNPSNPFGGNFLVLWLKEFDQKTAMEFLEKGLNEEDLKPEKAAILEIIKFTKGHPAYLNWFGEKCAQASNASLGYTRKLIQEIFKPQHLGYFIDRDLERLRMRGETKTYQVFVAMAKRRLFRPSEITKQLSGITISSVINYLRRLEQYGYVEKMGKGRYKIVDPVLEAYLAQT